MGCGASINAEDQVVPSAPAPVEVAAPAHVEGAVVSGGGSGFLALGAPPEPKALHLPFIRFDTTAVPKELSNSDQVYLSLTYRGGIISPDGGSVHVAEHPTTPPFHLAIERTDGNGPLIDGDEVKVCCIETGLYLEAQTDSGPLTCGDGGNSASIFKIFKQGRPARLQHRDTVYLMSWLSNYVGYEEDGSLTAKRWRRGEQQTMSVLKRAVLDAASTELARKMQFQAFDLDGNNSISRGEMEYMLTQLKGDVSSEELDEVMGVCDPAHTGNIPFGSFASWADNGGLPEEMFHHAEVLGNMAQRCNDCLKEERCLIEVLTVAHHDVCQAMLGKHQELFADDLKESIMKKSSEQDGWIFSNNWKTAMKALLESEVDLWTRALNDAMRGFGTDENTLTALVCTMPARLRESIFLRYEERYNTTLLDHIESETSFSYKKVLLYQTQAPERCKARILNEAMVGLGTSEDQLIRVITQCDLGERRDIKECYQRCYDRDLVDHVRSETSGDFQKALLCLLTAEEAPFDLDGDCAAMKAAMDGWGTDEAALISLICSKTPKQMVDVNTRFEELYGKSLLERVKSETSGNFQATMLGTIRGPMKELAHSVRYCIKGWGTDDRGLITCLVHLPDFKKAALIKEYQQEFGRDLISDIKGDTSGDYQNALLSLVRPAPEIWAEALEGAMKGVGTSDELLINFMVIAKDEMAEVRRAFYKKTGKGLVDWIEGECSGDYKNTLVALSCRNSEDDIDLKPLYWTQRCRDAITDVDSLKDILVSFPSVAIKRGTEVFHQVYGRDLRTEIEAKCGEHSPFFGFSNYWKKAMLSLLDMPVERYVKGLNDAMKCWGTDEFTLTGLVCTMPENLYEDIHNLYQEKYGRTLIDHIECETSFCYKKVLVSQALSWPESRAKALNGAMVGLGTAEDQLVRVIVCSTMKERRKIRDAYQGLYDRDLIEHVESETSGSFQRIMVAVLESCDPHPDFDYESDCNQLKEAMEGMGTDEDALIRVLAGKTPQQIQITKDKFEQMFDRNLYDWVNDETWDWGASIFFGKDFRMAMLYLLREPNEQLAHGVHDCIAGWGTDDTGLITLLVHLSERRRRDLCIKYEELFGRTLFDAIKGDTSGDYEGALLALVKPAPQVWAEALTGAMKGLGTSDELLINWMCIAKDRMDEVRFCFEVQHGRTLGEWIHGECSGDYADTLVRLAKRKCYKFPGAEAGLTIQAPPNQDDAVFKFNKVFNRLCHQKHDKPADNLVIPEDDQQEMGSVFAYFADRSSCAPELDVRGLWDLTNAVGFPPGDDGPDLLLTFSEWDYSGTGTISWNDFVREMSTRVNDPGHFKAAPLPET